MVSLEYVGKNVIFIDEGVNQKRLKFSILPPPPVVSFARTEKIMFVGKIPWKFSLPQNLFSPPTSSSQQKIPRTATDTLYNL